MAIRADTNEIEVFKEELEENMRYLSNHLSYTSNPDFAESLCEWYSLHDSLTAKQLPCAMRFWREAKNAKKGTGSEEW